MMKEYSGKKVLITGGLGFIGSNLAEKLLEYGADVTLYDNSLEPYGSNPANIETFKDNVTVVEGDVCDRDVLTQHIIDKDYIFHLAAQVGRDISMEKPHLDTEINCLGMLNLLEACRINNPEAVIVYSGSRGQVGEPVYLPVDEKHPDAPTDIYGINKLAAEMYILLYAKVYGTKGVSLRFNNVYGPKAQLKHGFYAILNYFIGLLLSGKPISVYGEGDQTRDYIYIDDIVSAVLLAGITPETWGNKYQIGSGVETKFLDMVKTIVKCAGEGSYEHVPFPEARKKIDISRFVVDFSPFNKVTGWTPKVSLGKGIQSTVDYCRENFKKYI